MYSHISFPTRARKRAKTSEPTASPIVRGAGLLAAAILPLVALLAGSTSAARAQPASPMDGATPPRPAGPSIPVRLETEFGTLFVQAALVDGRLVQDDIILAEADQTLEFVDADGQVVATGDLYSVFGDTLLAAPDGHEDAVPAPGITGLAVKATAQRWPDGVIPYKFDAAVPSSLRSVIGQAMAHWTARAPVNFIPDSQASLWSAAVTKAGGSYVVFKYWSLTNVGQSELGRRTDIKPQNIFLGSGATMGLAVHEIGHAFGLIHEHQRTDSESFVTVRWENIDPDYKKNFGAATGTYEVNVGPYNFESIMHYDSWAFAAKDMFGRPVGPTLTRKDGSTFTNQLRALSGGDVFTARYLYSGSVNNRYSGSDIISSHSFKCLDATAWSTADGTKVQQWACGSYQDNQRFIFRETAPGSSVFEIIHKHSGKCLDVANSGTANGTQVWQYTCNNTNAQRFRLVMISTGLYEIRSVISNKCVDVDSVAGSANGAKVQLWSCSGAAWQRFYVSPSTTP